MKNDNSIILLRIIHGLFAGYFIICVLYIDYSALIFHVNLFLDIAIVSIFLEGFLVYIINNGDCPLAPLQWKLGDAIPFFNLFLPKKIAKLIIPFFTVMTFLGILLLLFRYFSLYTK